MDSGKVFVDIPADVMALDAVGNIADKLGVALGGAFLGRVVSYAKLTYDPHTPESPEHGREWHRIILDLDKGLELRRAADLFLAAGAPPSSHITYGDQMRICGVSLGRV
jgi:hypothetical protein